MTLNDMTLEDMMDVAEHFARFVLIGTRDQIVPMFFYITGAGDSCLAPLKFESDQDKEAKLQALSALMKEQGALRYCTTAEAWLLSSEFGHDLTVRPSKSDARIEVVNITAVDRDGTVTSRIFLIERAGDGSCSALTKMDDPGFTIGGRMTELLLRPGETGRRPDDRPNGGLN